jgi:hypothetical protein
MSEHLSAEMIEADIYELPGLGDPARASAHFRECVACRTLRDQFRQERLLLEGALASVSMPSELGDRLAARIPGPPRRRGAHLLALVAPAWIAAAALAFLVLRLSDQVKELSAEVRRLRVAPSIKETSEPPGPMRGSAEPPSGRFIGLRGPSTPSLAVDAATAKKSSREDASAPARMLPSLTRLVRPPGD